MRIESISILFIAFYVTSQLRFVQGDIILPCYGLRNVTIIPYINIIQEHQITDYIVEDYQDSASQLIYLVKELLDSPCFTIWTFSPIQSRLIRLREVNYVQFFETELQAITRTDENEILKLLSNIPEHAKNDIKQSVFFVCFKHRHSRTNQSVVVTNQIKQLYQQQKFDLVLWCVSPTPLCWYSRHWLPKQNIIHDGGVSNNRKFNPYLHQIFLDVMDDPQYNWHQRYTKYAPKVQCSNKGLHIYFWLPIVSSNYLPAPYLFVDFVEEIFVNATLHIVLVDQTETSRDENYLLSSKKFEWVEWRHDKWQTENQTIEWLNKTEAIADLNIHIPFYHSHVKFESLGLPISKNQKTIRVAINDTITESPLLQNGTVMIWEEDYLSPWFATFMVERINNVMCAVN